MLTENSTALNGAKGSSTVSINNTYWIVMVIGHYDSRGAGRGLVAGSEC